MRSPNRGLRSGCWVGASASSNPRAPGCLFSPSSPTHLPLVRVGRETTTARTAHRDLSKDKLATMQVHRASLVLPFSRSRGARKPALTVIDAVRRRRGSSTLDAQTLSLSLSPTNRTRRCHLSDIRSSYSLICLHVWVKGRSPFAGMHRDDTTLQLGPARRRRTETGGAGRQLELDRGRTTGRGQLATAIISSTSTFLPQYPRRRHV